VAGTRIRERKESGTGSPGTTLPHLKPLPSRYVCQSRIAGSSLRLRVTGHYMRFVARPPGPSTGNEPPPGRARAGQRQSGDPAQGRDGPRN
jgi:hypothetical protein